MVGIFIMFTILYLCEYFDIFLAFQSVMVSTVDPTCLIISDFNMNCT